MELSSSNIKKFLILPEMELFSSKIKKCLIFLEINISYISERNFQTSKNSPRKNFLIFWKMELSGSNIKKFLIFSQKKFFLYSGKRKPWKSSLCLRKQDFFIFQETQTLKTNYILRSQMKKKCSKNEKKLLWKNVIYFGKLNFPTPSLKSFLYFRRKLAKPEK